MSRKNITKDFRKFAIDRGVRATVLDDQIKQAQNLTPYILEERQLNVATFDVFSRLMYDRIVYFSGEVDQDSCNTAIAQFLYLSSVENRDINLYINSPGGAVIDGLGLIDTMNYIPCDISTTCIGMAASMGAVLLSNGTRGKRYVLPHSRVMIHQVSSAMRGTVSDMEIEFEQTQRCKQDVYNILAKNTDRTFEEMEQLCDRNNWFIGQEAVDLRIADKVLDRDNQED